MNAWLVELEGAPTCTCIGYCTGSGKMRMTTPDFAFKFADKESAEQFARMKAPREPVFKFKVVEHSWC